MIFVETSRINVDLSDATSSTFTLSPKSLQALITAPDVRNDPAKLLSILKRTFDQVEQKHSEFDCRVLGQLYLQVAQEINLCETTDRSKFQQIHDMRQRILALESGPWYDTQFGVENACKNLEGFHTLRTTRYKSTHETEGISTQRLQDFYVLDGKYWLDTFGQTWKKQDDRGSYTMADLPPTTIACACCKQKWTIANIDDAISSRTSEIESLKNWVGKSFGEFSASLSSRKDAIYALQPDLMLRNDRLITAQNEKGWLREVALSYIIQPGDETYINKWKYEHGSCKDARIAAEVKSEFSQLFEQAGFKKTNLKFNPIKNEYGSASYNGPWFNVETPVGIIEIGWRKRVVNIDWSKTKLTTSFPEINATKGAAYIHTMDKAERIFVLSRLREIGEKSL